MAPVYPGVPRGALPGPRAPQDAVPRSPAGPEARRRHWYEHELGWPTTDGEPLGLPTGVRFDALGLPAGAGAAVLARVRPTGPVALDRRAGTLWFLTAAGSADELPELLRWLEWDGIALDLTARGDGGRIPAPVPVGIRSRRGGTPAESGPSDPREAVWLRPPRPGCEVEPTLPVTGLGGGGRAPDLVRLVSAAATECHRARLLRAGRSRRGRPTGVQPLAFSYASRMSAGTRPRSLTL
ncbi:SCO3374 family protein [Streptomyces sp. I05A-00742]|uniref:SCO3374 family protein n=1 Tax=Streptomyces sp. I05A-00742 TaxID=2732853 RepID=UPI00148818C6|nr:SCO3374 family protein [Streptomyces sp. I05A-00742]